MRFYLLIASLLLLMTGCDTPPRIQTSTVESPTREAAMTPNPTTVESTNVAPAATSGIFVPMLPGGEQAPTATTTPEPTSAPTQQPAADPPTAVPTTVAPTTVAPTATPYVSNIPDYTPRPELGPSKMGIHVARPNSEAIMAFVRAAHPAVVKGVDDLGFLAEVKAVSPQTVTLGRFSVDPQDYNGEPEAAAAALVARQLPQMLLNPAVDYWEGWNEPDPNLDRMDWYARFEAERVRQLAQHGLRAAVGGFSTGVPELNEFELFVPAIAEAQRHGGILTLHEYAAPDITFLFGDPLPGYPTWPDRGPLMFRYRWFYRDVLEPRGLVVPLVISEAGIDGILGNRPGPDGLGWQDFQEFWVEQGWGPDGQTAFLNQLQWVDNEARQDPYVIGYALFTAGGARAWTTYELAPFLPRLAEYIVSQRQ
jgi:hypothetical protein